MELKISLALPDEALLPELAAALEKRVELASRARLPGFGRSSTGSMPIPKARHDKYAFGGSIAVSWRRCFGFLSLVLLLPAFFAPQELGSYIPLG